MSEKESEEKKSKLKWAAEHLLAPLLVGVGVLVAQFLMTQEKTEKLRNEIRQVTNRVSNMENKIAIQGDGNQIANLSGDKSTAMQVGSMNINPKEDIRQDPKEIALLKKRIDEGEALKIELSKCKYTEKEINDIEKRANAWLGTTAMELGAISETSKQLFLAKPQLPMQVIRGGCSDDAFSMRRNIEVYLYNLRNILPRLTGKRQ